MREFYASFRIALYIHFSLSTFYIFNLRVEHFGFIVFVSLFYIHIYNNFLRLINVVLILMKITDGPMVWQVVVTHGGMLRESFHHSKRVHGRVVIITMIENPEHMLVKRSWL